jgi:hypothetical protein
MKPNLPAISAPVRKNNPGHLEVALTMPDGTTSRFAHLAFGAGTAFAELDWLGFSCTAEADTTFFIDNIRLQVQHENTK